MHTPPILSSEPLAPPALSKRSSAAFGAAASPFNQMLEHARSISHPARTTPLNPLHSQRNFKPLTPSPNSLKALNAHDRVAHRPAEVGEHDRLTRQARKLVAQTFYGTILKQMRKSPFKSELFSGGRGGEAYSSLADQHMAENMSRGSNKLVRALVRKLEAIHSGLGLKTPKPSPTGTKNGTPTQ